MMTAPAFATRTPRASNRALSANHTEAGAAKLPLPLVWEDRKPFVFDVGDEVVVVDKHHPYYEKKGVVRLQITSAKYGVKFNWSSAAIHPFKASQIAKVQESQLLGISQQFKLKVKPKRAAKSTIVKVDYFSCEWGNCQLAKHPDIPARWAARIKPSGGVIELPAPKHAPAPLFGANRGISEKPLTLTAKQQIAHEKFLAFMERLHRDVPLTPAERAVKMIEVDWNDGLLTPLLRATG